jgi:hypothetical protein
VHGPKSHFWPTLHFAPGGPWLTCAVALTSGARPWVTPRARLPGTCCWPVGPAGQTLPHPQPLARRECRAAVTKFRCQVSARTHGRPSYKCGCPCPFHGSHSVAEPPELLQLKCPSRTFKGSNTLKPE